jgi:hypothetical protein
MTPHANAASLQTAMPTVNAVLESHASALGRDAIPYRHHVYRVANLCLAIAPGDPAQQEKIAVAAVFHDLGIWTSHTFDYLEPSVALAREYLASSGHADWIPEIDAMIGDHHKITSARASRGPLAEPFRRADWIDVSRGLRNFGVPRPFIASVFAMWPSAGFHWRLVELAGDWFLKHPLTPLPMVKF